MATKASEQLTVPDYDEDFAGWCHYQSMLLRAKQLHALDFTHIAEELDYLGQQQFTEWRNFLALVIAHMLKWDYQPERRGRSWAVSIRTHRRHAAKHLAKNPSLKPRLDEALDDAYDQGLALALEETGKAGDDIPDERPYDWDAVMTRPFDWPAA